MLYSQLSTRINKLDDIFVQTGILLSDTFKRLI